MLGGSDGNPIPLPVSLPDREPDPWRVCPSGMLHLHRGQWTYLVVSGMFFRFGVGVER